MKTFKLLLALCLLSGISTMTRAELQDQGLNSIMEIIDKAIAEYTQKAEEDGDDADAYIELFSDDGSIVASADDTLGVGGPFDAALTFNVPDDYDCNPLELQMVEKGGGEWRQDALTIPGGTGEYMIRLYLITRDLGYQVIWEPGEAERLDDPGRRCWVRR